MVEHMLNIRGANGKQAAGVPSVQPNIERAEEIRAFSCLLKDAIPELVSPENILVVLVPSKSRVYTPN